MAEFSQMDPGSFFEGYQFGLRLARSVEPNLDPERLTANLQHAADGDMTLLPDPVEFARDTEKVMGPYKQTILNAIEAGPFSCQQKDKMKAEAEKMFKEAQNSATSNRRARDAFDRAAAAFLQIYALRR